MNRTQRAPRFGPDLAVVDQPAFEQTASYLAPDLLSSYLATIFGLSEELLQELNEPGSDTSCHSFVMKAHTLAGSAGLLGFTRVSTICRLFEQAVLSGSGDAIDLAESLRAALKATIAHPILGNGRAPTNTL